MEQHGDAKMTDLLQTLANCPKARSANIHDRCRGWPYSPVGRRAGRPFTDLGKGVWSPEPKQNTIDHAATIAISATRIGRSLRSPIGSALEKLSYIWMFIMTAFHYQSTTHRRLL